MMMATIAYEVRIGIGVLRGKMSKYKRVNISTMKTRLKATFIPRITPKLSVHNRLLRARTIISTI